MMSQLHANNGFQSAPAFTVKLSVCPIKMNWEIRAGYSRPIRGVRVRRRKQDEQDL